VIVTDRLVYKFHQVFGFFAGVFRGAFEAELKDVFGSGLVKKTFAPGNTAPDPLKIKSVSAFN
jgi:hypothetical protein